MATVAPGNIAPGLAGTWSQRDTVYNQTFGGTLVNIGKTQAYNGAETAALLMNVAGMVTCKRFCCLCCCDAWCPLGYTDGERTYEYSLNSSCCCCCKKAWMQANRGNSADVEEGKPGATLTPLGYSFKPEGCCYCGQETFSIGDMVQDHQNPGQYVKGPLKYGIRNKPDCCKVGCCALYAEERAACGQIFEGNVVAHTMMPIYYNPAGGPTDPAMVGKYGTQDDWESRSTVIGTVTTQNILMPCFCCCAQPGFCPLNIKVDLNKEYAATVNDDEKIKLGLFAHAASTVPIPGTNLYADVLPLPFNWFGSKALLMVGYAFGWGMTNTEIRYTGLKEAFASGMAETGDLIPRAIDSTKTVREKAMDSAKAAVGAGSQAIDSAMAAGSEAIGSLTR